MLLRYQPPPLKWDANEPNPPRETPDELELWSPPLDEPEPVRPSLAKYDG